MDTATEIAYYLLSPLTIVILLVGIGSFVWFWRPQKRLGPLLAIIGLIVFFIFSLPITANYLLCSLESEAEDYVDINQITTMGIKNIIVVVDDQGDLYRKNRDAIIIKKLFEAVRLWKINRKMKILLLIPENASNPHTLKWKHFLATNLKVASQSIVAVTYVKKEPCFNTEISRISRYKPFCLIVEPYKFSRLRKLVNTKCQHCIVAPFKFGTCENQFASFWYIPSGQSLFISSIAIKEYVSLLLCNIFDLLPANGTNQN